MNKVVTIAYPLFGLITALQLADNPTVQPILDGGDIAGLLRFRKDGLNQVFIKNLAAETKSISVLNEFAQITENLNTDFTLTISRTEINEYRGEISSILASMIADSDKYKLLAWSGNPLRYQFIADADLLSCDILRDFAHTVKLINSNKEEIKIQIIPYLYSSEMID